MVICKNCGVALDDEMLNCLLCGSPVHSQATNNSEKQESGLIEGTFFSPYSSQRGKVRRRKITWEVVSIVLVCIGVATSTINWLINKQISWSEYPVSICLIVFSYISVFAFWEQKTVIQLWAGFLAAAVSLLLLDFLTNNLNWALDLGIPLLFAANAVTSTLILAIQLSRHKGVNLVAYGFLAVAILCILIEIILDWYLKHSLRLVWSMIVGVCILPVCIVLLLMHFRFKRGRDLQKTFHI